MGWRWGTVHAPKQDCEEATYEDALRVGLDGDHQLSFRAAIGDGATESAFARLWTEMLVEAYVADGSWLGRLDSLARAWAADVWSRDLPWNVKAKASGGAHAALVGTVVTSSGPEQWRVHADIYGDSCWFILEHDGVVCRAAPYEQPSEFDRRPYLLSTMPDHRERALLHRTMRRAHLDRRHIVLLCTDAVGRWLLEAAPEQARDLADMAFASDQGAFADWLGAARADQSIKDDDSTVFVVTQE